MDAHAHATLDGVEPLAAMTSHAKLPTAATMAPPTIKTRMMAVLVLATKVGVEMVAVLTSLARPRKIAVPTVKLPIRIALMVATASVNSDGKVTAVMHR